MRTGITNGSFAAKYGEKRYEKMKAFGFDATDFDLSNTDTVFYTANEAESDRLLLEEKRLADEAGIEIWQVHGPWRWPPHDLTDEDRAERLEKMKRSLRMTSLLGCKYWVIHPVLPYGTEDLPAGLGEKTWEMNRAFQRELLNEAKKYGVTVCLENMPWVKFSIASPEQTLTFVKEMNDEQYKMCYDTGHCNVFPGLKIADELRRIKDEVRVLHVHDNKWNGDMHLFPFFGTSDWDAFSAALREIGFDGVLSLETAPPVSLPLDAFEPMMEGLSRIAASIAGK